MRIVPNQTTDKVEALVKSHLERKWRARGSPNSCLVTMVKKGECWVSDVRHPNYEAARSACKMVFGVEPQYTRLGKRRKRVKSNPNETPCYTYAGRVTLYV